MYDYYYGEQIYNRLGNTNQSIEEIIENQNTIIRNQEILISGDNEIITRLDVNNFYMQSIVIILVLIVIYHFIERMLKT